MEKFVKRKSPEAADQDPPSPKKTSAPPSPKADRDSEIGLLRVPFKTLPDEKAIEAHFAALAEVRPRRSAPTVSFFFYEPRSCTFLPC